MQRFVIISLLSLSVSLLGCSGRPAGMPALYPCKITVTQEDVPLADATVIMSNVSDPTLGDAWSAMGRTDSDGVAVIQTNGQYPGAPAGTYKIIVEKINTESARFGPRPPAGTPELVDWEDKTTFDDTVFRVTLVEPLYSSSNTPHEIEVKKGTNEMSIDVGKAVKIKN